MNNNRGRTSIRHKIKDALHALNQALHSNNITTTTTMPTNKIPLHHNENNLANLGNSIPAIDPLPPIPPLDMGSDFGHEPSMKPLPALPNAVSSFGSGGEASDKPLPALPSVDAVAFERDSEASGDGVPGCREDSCSYAGRGIEARGSRAVRVYWDGPAYLEWSTLEKRREALGY